MEKSQELLHSKLFICYNNHEIMKNPEKYKDLFDLLNTLPPARKFWSIFLYVPNEVSVQLFCLIHC